MSQLTTLFTDIANAIREKKGTSEPIVASDFPTEIASISGGGGSWNFGYNIDIQAQNTITKGDKIVAQTNSGYVAPTLGETQSDNGIVCVSKDMSVAIKNSSLNYANNLANGYSVTVLFRDTSGQYGDGVVLTFTDFPTSNFSLYNSFLLNDDGTLAYSAYFKTVSNATSYENVCIVIEIDKENKTAQYYYTSVSFDNIACGGTSSQNYIARIDSPDLSSQNIINTGNLINGTNGHAIGDYVICVAQTHVMNNPAMTYQNNTRELIIMKYSRTTHTFSLVYYMTPRDFPISIGSNFYISGNYVMLDENTVVFSATNSTTFYYVKYNFQTHDITYSSGISSSSISHGIRLSGTGLYVCNVSTSSSNSIIKIYRVSSLDFSYTLVTEVTMSAQNRAGGICYVSDDGRYVYSSMGILYDVVDQVSYVMSSLGTGYTAYVLNGFFNVNDFIVVKSMTSPIGSTFLALTPSSNNAEYLASSTQSTDCSTADRVYGIASEDLTVGQVGQAKALFVTGGGT